MVWGEVFSRFVKEGPVAVMVTSPPLGSSPGEDANPSTFKGLVRTLTTRPPLRGAGEGAGS